MRDELLVAQLACRGRSASRRLFVSPSFAQLAAAQKLDKEVWHSWTQENIRKQYRWRNTNPAIYDQASGPDADDFARAVNALGQLYEQEGRVAEAEPLYRRSPAMWKKRMGPTPRLLRPG